MKKVMFYLARIFGEKVVAYDLPINEDYDCRVVGYRFAKQFWMTDAIFGES